MKLITRVILLLLLSASSWAAQSSSLDQLLVRTGKSVDAFLGRFGSVTCMEAVSQQKLKPNGKSEYREDSKYELLVMIRESDGELKIDETRQARAEGKHLNKQPLLVTNGFSTLLLVFHPHFQRAFHFRQLEEGQIDGKPAVKVGFEHIRGSATPAALVLRGRQYPLEWTGSAWIDAQSGTILRITAELSSSLEDLGIRAIKSDVAYHPVQLSGNTYWLPSSAVIDLETPRQHWRNTHNFDQYKRFSVSTTITVPDYDCSDHC